MRTSAQLQAEKPLDPLVTIAIPTFNRAAWLEDCVRSALAQDYHNFEVLVSDNASDDNTAEVLKEIQDPRLRVVRQARNIGLRLNWNACLAEARGDYIVFVSDDDRIDPWLLPRCMQLVTKEPAIPIIIGLSDMFYVEEGYLEPAIVSRRLETGIWDGIEILREFFQNSISAPMCTIMMRTETFRAGGGFPLNFPNTADTAGWAPLLLTHRAGLVNERCGTCRVHGHSQTSSVSHEDLLAELGRLTELIIAGAQRDIADPQRRSIVSSYARRYFALSGIYLLGSRRKEGVKFREVLPTLWRWRRALVHIAPGDVFTMAKPLAYLFLPLPVTSALRRLRSAVTGRKTTHT
jgi:hypothetical protein